MGLVLSSYLWQADCATLCYILFIAKRTANNPYFASELFNRNLFSLKKEKGILKIKATVENNKSGLSLTVNAFPPHIITLQISSRQRSTDGHKEVLSTARWAEGLASDASGSISGVQGVMTALQASSQPSILKTNSSAVAYVNAGGAATKSFSFPFSIFFNIVCFVQWGGRRVVVLGPSPPLFLFCPLIMTTKKRKFFNHSDVIKININANAEVAESKQNQCQSFCLRGTMMSPPLGPTPYPNIGLSKRVGHPGGLTSRFAVCRQPLGAFNKADPRKNLKDNLKKKTLKDRFNVNQPLYKVDRRRLDKKQANFSRICGHDPSATTASVNACEARDKLRCDVISTDQNVNIPKLHKARVEASLPGVRRRRMKEVFHSLEISEMVLKKACSSSFSHQLGNKRAVCCLNLSPYKSQDFNHQERTRSSSADNCLGINSWFFEILITLSISLARRKHTKNTPIPKRVNKRLQTTDLPKTMNNSLSTGASGNIAPYSVQCPPPRHLFKSCPKPSRQPWRVCVQRKTLIPYCSRGSVVTNERAPCIPAGRFPR
ncbi:hypothetical protein TNCV_3357521 [Trichonephila clavipes]|nr:hypothetical protein TNCV_3357521 [Trichonephila clavipes]